MHETRLIPLNFGIRLNAQSWHAALSNFMSEAEDDIENLRGTTVHVDLSEAGFADFATLGHLLIFIDTVIAAHGNVVLRYPSPDHIDAHLDTEAAARRQRQRKQCALFLKQSGFTTAVHHAGWPRNAFEISGRELSANDPAERGTEFENQQVEDPRPPRRLRRVLPYHWVSAPGNSHRAALEDGLIAIGLTSETAAAMAEGLIVELIDHVAEQPDRRTKQHKVLVGACITVPDSYLPQITDFHTGFHELITWAGRQSGRSPISRVFVGCAGQSPPIRHVVAQWKEHRRRWNVTQIVRSYQGGLILSSDGRATGITFADNSSGGFLPRYPAPGLPNSTVECVLLVTPDATVVLSDREIQAPAGTAIRERARLECMTVNVNSASGIESADLAGIRERLEGLATTSSLGLVVAVNAYAGGSGPGHLEIAFVLGQLLEVSRELTNAAALVVAMPGTNRRLLALAVDDLTSAEDSARSGTVHPVLLVAPEQRHYWLGTDDDAHDVLRHLSKSTRSCSLTELARANGGIRPHDAVRRIHEGTLLLRLKQGQVRLTVHPEDAIDALTTHLAQQIKKAIESGDHPGVKAIDPPRAFLTPNLRTTNRWVDVSELLAHVGAEQLAGFTLAHKAMATVSGLDHANPPAVFRLGAIARGFVSTFARSLTGSDRYFNSEGSLRLAQAGGTLPQAAEVLIVTGTVMTDDDLTIALDQLASLDITPVAIAAVVDARETGRNDTCPVEINHHTFKLPLVSLTSVDISPSGPRPRTFTCVDPLLERPDVTEKPVLRTMFRQEDYVETLKRARAARLAHIARPAGRHYTAYVDPTLLFRDPNWERRFFHSVVHKVRQAQESLSDDAKPVTTACIAYPAETTDNIAEVAAGLANALSGIGYSQPPVVMPIPRAVLGTHWLMPASVHFPSAEHMIVLDSATGTGRTIQQMLRVAAGPDVRLITCVVILNGLDDLDALALQQVATVSAPSTRIEKRRRAVSRNIPVQLHFAARSAVSSLDARDCDVCKLRHAYESIPVLAPLPPKLAKHRSWLLANLAPRSKRRAYEEEATDLAGMHIGQVDCVEYLRWKFELREATTSTLRRLEVVEKLKRVAHHPRQGDALVRLLAAEASWLHSAPLNLTSVRARLVALAGNLVLGDNAPFIDPSLRVEAVILLATVQPLEFIQRFSELLVSNRHEYVIAQVLFEALRLIVGPEAPWRVPREVIIQRFIHKLSILENEMRDNSKQQNDRYGTTTVSDIRYLISHARRRLLPIPTDEQGAWMALGNYRRSVDEHSMQNKMVLLITTFEYLPRGLTIDPDAIKEDWRECADFLAINVMPNLEPIRPMLLSPWGLRRLTGPDIARWDEVVRGAGPQQLDDITNRIDAILAGNRDHGRTTSIDELVADLHWWNSFFLTAHVDPGVSNESAYLTELIKKCPADLTSVLNNAFGFAEAVITVESPDSEAPSAQLVFCPDDLLREIAGHVVLNATRYYRVAGGTPRFEIDVRTAKGDADRVEVLIRNTDSAPRSGSGGKGLATLDAKLKVFGGGLSTVDDVADPWTFGVMITLERWRAT